VVNETAETKDKIIFLEQQLHYTQPIRVLGTTYFNSQKYIIGFRFQLRFKTIDDLSSIDFLTIQLRQPSIGFYPIWSFLEPLGALHVFTAQDVFKTIILIHSENTTLEPNPNDSYGVFIKFPVSRQLCRNRQFYFDIKFKIQKIEEKINTRVLSKGVQCCAGQCSCPDGYNCKPGWFGTQCVCTTIDQAWTNGNC
jgi:hypothetical protein